MLLSGHKEFQKAGNRGVQQRLRSNALLAASDNTSVVSQKHARTAIAQQRRSLMMHGVLREKFRVGALFGPRIRPGLGDSRIKIFPAGGPAFAPHTHHKMDD
jgi:hypothetical protein